MNFRIPLFALSVVITLPGFAVEKKTRKKSGSTLPPTSPMLMISASATSTVDSMESNGLITTKLGGRDLDFFESLLDTGQLQVVLGELVKTRAESPQVKSVGMILASTQVAENKQINRLATLTGLALSAAAAGAQRQTSAELEKLSGATFDIACVSKIVEANRETVRAYEEGAESKNAEIQSFSEQMLPIARERLRITEKMSEGPEKPAPAEKKADEGGAAPEKPTPSPATPAQRAPPVQLRTPPPSPAKQPHKPSPSPSAPAATPPSLTLGTPEPVPFPPAQPPALATPPPSTVSPVLRKIEDRLLTPPPPPVKGGVPPIPSATPSPASATPGSGTP
jgi:predicted outer membrane protein